MGCPRRIMIEDTFFGEATHRELSILESICQAWSGMPGQTAGLAWRAEGLRRVSVSLTPREGRTILKIECDLAELAQNLFGTVIGLGFVAAFLLQYETAVHSALGLTRTGAAFAAGGLLLVLLVVARVLFARYGRGAQAPLDELRGRLVRSLSARPTKPPGAQPPAEKLPPDDIT